MKCYCHVFEYDNAIFFFVQAKYENFGASTSTLLLMSMWNRATVTLVKTFQVDSTMKQIFGVQLDLKNQKKFNEFNKPLTVFKIQLFSIFFYIKSFSDVHKFFFSKRKFL